MLKFQLTLNQEAKRLEACKENLGECMLAAINFTMEKLIKLVGAGPALEHLKAPRTELTLLRCTTRGVEGL